VGTLASCRPWASTLPVPARNRASHHHRASGAPQPPLLIYMLRGSGGGMVAPSRAWPGNRSKEERRGWRTIRWCFSEFLPCDFLVWSWLLLLESVGFSPGSCAVDSHFFSSRKATRDGRSGEQSEAARRGADARREKARAGKNRRGMARAGNPGLFFLRYGWATSPGGWSVGPTGTGGWVHMWWVTKELHF
jgi:hypothetical protein